MSFDLRKFLTENKLTKISNQSVNEIDDVFDENDFEVQGDMYDDYKESQSSNEVFKFLVELEDLGNFLDADDPRFDQAIETGESDPEQGLYDVMFEIGEGTLSRIGYYPIRSALKDLTPFIGYYYDEGVEDFMSTHPLLSQLDTDPPHDDYWDY